MPTKDITKTIANSIKALKEDQVHAWTKVALIVLQVEENSFWETSHRSFTEWLVAFGESIGLKEGSLWRYYRAAKYYQELQPLLRKNRIPNPALSDLPAKVSPENIEILGKLERVMPSDVFVKFADQVISAVITRESLREAWLNYRPILDGRTARGMGVPIPRVDLKDKVQQNQLLEAHVFTALSQTSGSWLGSQKPFMFEMLRGEITRFIIAGAKSLSIDAMAIVQMQANGPIELHGIEIKSSNAPEFKYDSIKKIAPNFDFIWIAFHDYDPKRGVRSIPNEFGLLELKLEKIELIKMASRINSSTEAQLSLVKKLLAKLIKK